MAELSKKQEVLALVTAIIYAGTIRSPEDLSKPGLETVLKKAQEILNAVTSDLSKH